MNGRLKAVIITLNSHRENLNSARENIHLLRFIEENLPAGADNIDAEYAAKNAELFLECAKMDADFSMAICGTTRRANSLNRIVKNRLIRLHRDVIGGRLP